MKRPLAHRAIYKPEGPAAEYAVWGCNLYKGCRHQCTYCYLRRGPMGKQLGGDVPEIEKKVGGTEEKAYRRFCKEVDAYQEQFKTDGGIFFSFSTDPLLQEQWNLTYRCARYALEHGVPVWLLTKTTWWYRNAQFLWEYRDLLHIGFTLTGHNELEPYAPSNADRITFIRRLHDMGFHIWVSLEPVIDFESSLTCILNTTGLVEEYRIGLLSPYSKNRYDWQQCDRFMDAVHKLQRENGFFKVVWKDSIKKFYNEQKPE